MSLKNIYASNGNGEAVRATVTAVRAEGSTTITVDSLVNYPDYFIGTYGTITADNTLDPTDTVVFFGHKDSGKIVIDNIVPGYTDAGNTVGQAVLIKPSTAWANQIANILAVSLADDGTFNADAAIDMAAKLDGKAIRTLPRISVIDTTATLTPDIDTYNIYEVNALASTMAIAEPTGTPNDGDVMIFRIKATANCTLNWDTTVYKNVSGLSYPNTIPSGKWLYVGVVYNATLDQYQIVSVTFEA